MQAFLAILRYDIAQLARSWLVRIWILLLVVPAAFWGVVAAAEGELASETLAFYTGFVLAPLSVFAGTFIAVGAIAGEASVIADSILSRSVTRMEYMSAKIVARLGVMLGIYLGVMLPFSYLIIRYAVPDTTTGGVIVGLMMVGALLAFLAALGIALSTLMRNTLLAGMILMLAIVFPGLILQLLGLNWMSSTAVIYELPSTFRGETPAGDQAGVLIIFLTLTAVALLSSLWAFRRKDL